MRVNESGLTFNAVKPYDEYIASAGVDIPQSYAATRS